MDGNEKKAIKIIIFFLPVEIIPAATSGLQLNISGFLIWVMWLGRLFFGNKYVKYDKINNVRYVIILLYYFCISGIILGLNNQHEDFDYFSNHVLNASPSEQIINISLFILTSILFIKLLYQYKYDFPFQKNLINIFIITVFLQLLSVFIDFTKLNELPLLNRITSFVASDYDLQHGLVKRYSGLLGNYELIVDYCMIVIAFSITVYNYSKTKYFISIVFAFVLALASGTRSFLIVFLIFIISIYFINLFKNKLAIKYSILVFFSIVTIFLLYQQYFSQVPIFYRAEMIFKLQDLSDYDTLTNREFSKTPLIIESASILGKGSFYLWHLDNVLIVSHNVFLAFYAKYGIVGFLFILILFVVTIYRLLKFIFKIKFNIFQNEAIILLSLVISLFFQQIKISFIRELTPILMYIFLFVYIDFFLTRTNAILQKDNNA